MKAVEIMTTGVVTVQSEASVREAARLMLEHRVSGLPVVDDVGRLAGIVTEGDFCAALKLALNCAILAG
jgi:CBS domain-containing protein